MLRTNRNFAPERVYAVGRGAMCSVGTVALPDPALGSGGEPLSKSGRSFNIFESVDRHAHVLRVSGELDVETSTQLIDRWCRAPSDLPVVVDLADVTFMDCAGYRALVHSREAVCCRTRVVTYRNGSGQPQWFIELLSTFELS
jgi:anti-anti-sigma factor